MWFPTSASLQFLLCTYLSTSYFFIIKNVSVSQLSPFLFSRPEIRSVILSVPGTSASPSGLNNICIKPIQLQWMLWKSHNGAYMTAELMPSSSKKLGFWNIFVPLKSTGMCVHTFSSFFYQGNTWNGTKMCRKMFPFKEKQMFIGICSRLSKSRLLWTASSGLGGKLGQAMQFHLSSLMPLLGKLWIHDNIMFIMSSLLAWIPS